MKITEVRIFQKEDDDKKLRAFASVTIDDCFVVRDIKIIEGSQGTFVAMPSRRIKEPCPRCHHGNVVHSRYCNQCGAHIETVVRKPESEREPRERQSEHRDIAHPITRECRDMIQTVVLEAYRKEKGKLREGTSRKETSF